jgi:ribosome biogenesis GTPase
MSDARAETESTARVVASFGRHHLIDRGGELLTAVRRGKRGDVIVGDLVRFERTGVDQAVIDAVLPRASLLYRADRNRAKEMAANVDQVAIVYAAQPAFNIRFIWRALAAAHAAGVESLVILNKIDLPDLAAAQARLEQMQSLGTRTLAVSARRNPDATRAALRPLLAQRATLLIGQSGMGKSTMLNLLVPGADVLTQEFSRHLNLGRHTTTSSRWFALPGGGALIDSPGFQAFGLSHLDAAAIVAALPEFAPHLGRCRFLDCRHLAEPDCAIRAAVDAGGIDTQRYDFYRELLAEHSQ